MPASAERTSDLARTTQVIAVADVVESVRLMEQDEQEFIRRWQRFVGFVQKLLPGQSGRLRKSLGDGLMLEFSEAEGCIRAALAMRAWFADANRHLAPEDQVQLRVGAHMAEFVSDEYDIYGNDVNLAARIATLAGPGEIVISAALREHLGPTLRAQLEDLGTCHLKHVKDPVHVFRLGPAGQAPVLPVRRLATHALRPTMAVLPFGLLGTASGKLTGEALADDIVSTTGPRTGPSRPKPVVIVDPVLKCLPGQKLARGKCIDRPLVIACDRNERRVEGKCMKIPGVSIHCLPGYVQKGRECVKKPVIATACRQGEIRLNGKCVRKPSVSISCRKGFKLVGKACVRVPALTRTCPPGGKLVRGTCVGKKSAIRMSGPKTKQLIGRDGNNAMRLGTPSGKLRRAR